MNKAILVNVKGPSGKVRTYSSLKAAARVLSGNGTTNKFSTIRRHALNGGGFIGKLYISRA